MRASRWIIYLMMLLPLAWFGITGTVDLHRNGSQALLTGIDKELLGVILAQEDPGRLDLFEQVKFRSTVDVGFNYLLLSYLPVVLSLISLTFFTIYMYIFLRLRTYERSFLFLIVLKTLAFLLWLDLTSAQQLGRTLFAILPLLPLSCLFFIKQLYDFKNISVNMLLFLPPALVISFIGITGNSSLFFQFYGVFIFFVSVNLVLLTRRFHFESKGGLNRQKKRKVSLAFITHLLTSIPWGVYSLAAFYNYSPGPASFAFFFFPAGLPILFIGLNLQMGKLFFEAPVNSFFLRVVFFFYFSFLVFFSGIYQVLLDAESYWFFSLVLIPIMIDPLRMQFYHILNDFLRKKALHFHDFLLQLSGTLINPIQIDSLVRRIISLLKLSLNIRFVKLVIAEEEFQNWKPAGKDVILLAKDHSLWKQLKFFETINTTGYFTQNAIGPVRNFLLEQEAFVIVPLKNFHAGILISDKLNMEPMFSEEVEFLKTCANQLQPLFINYKVQIEKVQLVRKKREVELAGRVQKSLIPSVQEMGPATFFSYYRPSIGASGDYVDLIPINSNNFIVMLGDVSGHGLGSAYIMALVRAMVRSLREVHKAPLPEIFKRLNYYLNEEYGGTDFMTLLAIQVEKKRGFCELTTINAGQYPAVILYKDGRLERVGKSQRLLGVLDQDYSEEVIQLNEPARLFIYSDGAFEVFNEDSKILGQKKLLEWVQISRDLEPLDQINLLVDRLNDFASPKHSAPDDLSLISLQFTESSFYQTS